jgi:sec-independent protein translocase protein TatB
MFNLDPGKLLVIAVVAIILLGPDRLPQVARQVGAAWRSFNEFRHRMESEVRSSMPDLPPTSEIARLARSPSALLNHLSNMSEDGAENLSSAEAGAGNGAVAGDGGGVDAAGAESAGAGEARTGEAGVDEAGVDEAEAVTGNGAGSPGGGNGSAGTASASEVSAPSAPVTPPPAPWSPQTPASHAPETTVPVDPSLN